MGNSFIVLNPDNQYELTNEQSDFILKNFFLDGIFLSETIALFRCFYTNLEKETLSLNLDDYVLPRYLRAVCSLLVSLSLLEKEDSIVYANKKYLTLLKNLPSSGSGFPPNLLKRLIAEEEKIGETAERLVLEYERKRLIQLRRKKRAILIKHVSMINANIGYDIASFDDNKSLDYNRFIEVKGSLDSKVRFFWSINEIQTAKKLGDKYWIYFIQNVYKANTSSLKPIMIQNPIKRLKKLDSVIMNPVKFLIEEKEEGFLISQGKEISLGKDVIFIKI